MNEQPQAPRSIADLSVKIFADGADLDGIRAMAALPHIAGFTTNPTLMRKAEVEDYERFSREVIDIVGVRHLSLEVFSDEFDEMESQALKIASWSPSVFVKIPVTDTHGTPSYELIRRLSSSGVQLNVTALMTVSQVDDVVDALTPGANACVSLFAGRVADTGRDPLPAIVESLAIVRRRANTELIWASPRELLNIVQASNVGCDIITVTNDLLAKLPLLGHDLTEYSLDTVKMFRRDAVAAGYSL